MIEFLTNIVYSFMRDSFIEKYGMHESMHQAEIVVILALVFFSFFVIAMLFNLFVNVQTTNNTNKLQMTLKWAILEFILQFWVNAIYICFFVFITIKIHIVVFLILGVLELIIRAFFVLSDGDSQETKYYNQRGPISWLSVWVHYGVASYQLYFMKMEEYDNKLEKALTSNI